MLDRAATTLIKPLIDRLARALLRTRLSANQITLIGFSIGMVAAILIANNLYKTAAVAIFLSRLCDALDGAVARLSVPTDSGGFLDIALDFLFYASIPLAFAVANPVQNALPAAVLFELEYGLLRSTRPEAQQKGMDAAMAAYRVLPLDARSVRAAARVKYTLEVAGTHIGHGDQLIAGIALANDLTLITRNTREFSRVAELRVENWFDTPPGAPAP